MINCYISYSVMESQLYTEIHHQIHNCYIFYSVMESQLIRLNTTYLASLLYILFCNGITTISTISTPLRTLLYILFCNGITIRYLWVV